MNSILALDLGTQTGWALLTQGRIFSGSHNLQNSRFSGGGMRFLRFRYLLDAFKEKNTIDAVYFEEVRRHLGVDAAHVYGGFLAQLSAWAEDNNIPYQGVGVGTIKRYMTGKGHASKAEMIAAVRARGFAPVDDNEADSLALLLWARDNLGMVQ